MRTLLLVLASISLQGCTSVSSLKRPFAATGGSKADGTVVFTRQVGRYLLPKNTNDLITDDTRQEALRHCVAWGFKGAEQFDRVVVNCDEKFSRFMGGCGVYQVSITFQCTGETK